MEMSWDGSIISMSEVNPPSSRSSSHSRGPPHPPPARTSSQLGLRSAFEGTGNAQAALLPSPPERAYLSSSTRPSPTFTSTSPDPPPPLDPRGPAPPAAPPQHRPPLAHSLSHPLASFLHDSLSPPSSPTASIASSSFPGGSRTRLSSCAGASSALSSHEASPRSRSARRRTRARSRSRTGSASASSTASTDGSAHEDRAGELSSEDDHHGHASGLVMPSLHLDAARAPARRSSSSPKRAPARACECGAPSPPRRAHLLVLGKSADDRRTLARLVAGDDDEHEDDLRRTTSPASVAGATDMSFSYLSFRPSSSSSRERPASSARAAAAQCASTAFEPLGHAADAPVALWHPARDEIDAGAAAELVDELTRPLERLEAKISRTYPATTGLVQVVEAAGCGEFEACLFLFSSPPLASEIALARPISHVLPLLPVLVLPPSPTGKPQKTTALSQAVQEQLNTAGVRWAPALAAPCSAATCASPLYMLPHDLFVQHAHEDDDDELRRVPRLVPSTSGASMPASSPESEDAPPSSLSSSQEFVTPLDRHPTSSYYTSAGSSVVGDHREREFGPSSASAAAGRGAARSLSASSRAGSSSSRSSSPRGHGHGHAQTRPAMHTRRRNLSLSSFASSSAGAPPSSSAAPSSTSLADLHRLQSLVHDPAAPALLRARRARAFLEWREVEVAARVSSGGARDEAAVEVPEAWGERALDDVEEGGGTGRRMLDFSRRVAERRRVLAGRTVGPSAIGGPHDAGEEQDDDGDVLAASDDDDEHEHEAGRATGAASFATEPMTPRCAHRPLFSPLTTRTAPAPSDSYFPAVAATTSSASPVDPLALSTHSLAPSTSTYTSSTSGAPSSALAASSVLVLPSSDPFHLPSLLHLVGLNLRLAVFAPTFASTAASSAGSSASRAASSTSSSSSSSAREKREAERARQEGGGMKQGAPRPWAWWRTAAAVALVFAAGVAVGTVVASASVPSEAQAVGPAAWTSRGRF
ncbi:hypothetical protein JCM9279_001165 [Rhodotorula babjevae]